MNKSKLVKPKSNQPKQSKPRNPVKQKPRSTVLSKGHVIINHSELVDTITAQSNTFSIYGKLNGYAINAGSAFTFPWLYKVARCYDKYRFHSLKFTLKSRNPVTFSGSVFLALDTDTTDPPPTTSSQMMSMRYSKTAIVYDSLELSLSGRDCIDLHRPMTYGYVKERNGPDALPNVSTVGRLFFASSLTQTSNFDLYVTYTVELMDAQLTPDAVGKGQLAGSQTLKSNQQPQFIVPPEGGFTGYVALPVGEPSALAIDLKKIQGRLLETILAGRDGTGQYGPGQIFGLDGVAYTIMDEGFQRLINNVSQSSTVPFKVDSGFGQTGAEFDDKADGTYFTWDIEEMLRLYPTARYLVPLITSLTGPMVTALYGKYKAEL